MAMGSMMRVVEVVTVMVMVIAVAAEETADAAATMIHPLSFASSSRAI
jgi:hypothetical protein